MMRLRPVIDRYSEAIEWDLLVLLGVDLLEFFRGERSWLQLGRFLRQLSHHPDSHFMVEQAKDPEIAQALYERRQTAKKEQRARKYRPSPYEWGVVPQLLKGILDRLGELEAVMASRPLPRGAKWQKPPKPFPEPETAMETVELRARIAYFETLDAEIEEAQERYRQEHGSDET